MIKRLFSILLAISLLIPPSVWAAVTYDTDTSGQKASPGTTLTVSHTVTAGGSNRAIYVLCGIDSATATLTATYAGAAMTAVRNDAHASVSTRTYIFRKADPATGANNWVVTQSVGEPMICWALSATGVHQTTPETDSDGTCPAATASVTLTLTTASGELLLDILGFSNTDATAVTEGADQTAEMLLEQGTAYEAAGSRQPGSAGGVMSYSWTTNTTPCYSAVSIKAAPGSGASPPIIFP